MDTAIVGFKWDKSGQASVTKFTDLERFTIKVTPPHRWWKENSPSGIITRGLVFSDFTETRIVTGRSPSPTAMEMECKPSLAALVCGDSLGMTPWVFSHDNTTYTRAFFAGPPAGGRRDSNIWIAYGTCTKF
jgi:hypothetical protein